MTNKNYRENRKTLFSWESTHIDWRIVPQKYFFLVFHFDRKEHIFFPQTAVCSSNCYMAFESFKERKKASKSYYPAVTAISFLCSALAGNGQSKSLTSPFNAFKFSVIKIVLLIFRWWRLVLKVSTDRTASCCIRGRKKDHEKALQKKETQEYFLCQDYSSCVFRAKN